MSQTQPVQRVGLTLGLLFASAFLAGVGFGIYMPFIPIQALNMGAPPWIATALVFAFPYIMALIVEIPVGIYADRSGRRVEIILIGLVISAIATALMAFATNWIELTIYRTITGLAFAFGALYLAVTGLVTPPERRGLWLGLMAGTMLLGMGVSEIPSGIILSMIGYKGMYLLATAFLIISLLLLIPVKAPRVKIPTISTADFGKVFRVKGVYWVAISIMVYLLGWQILYPSFSVVLSEVFKAPAALTGAIFSVATILLGVGSYIWGPVVDRLGGRMTLFMAIVISAILTFIILAGLTNMWFYSVLFWLVTLFGVVGMPGTTYVAQRSVSPEYYSIATTIIWLFIVIPGIISGFLAGAILTSLGLRLTVIVTGIIELIGGLMMLGLPKV